MHAALSCAASVAAMRYQLAGSNVYAASPPITSKLHTRVLVHAQSRFLGCMFHLDTYLSTPKHTPLRQRFEERAVVLRAGMPGVQPRLHCMYCWSQSLVSWQLPAQGTTAWGSKRLGLCTAGCCVSSGRGRVYTALACMLIHPHCFEAASFPSEVTSCLVGT